MKIRCYIFYLFCLCACLSTYAQLPRDFRSEQIFLGTANTECNINDTIRLDGLVTCLSNTGMHPYSKYLYVELLNSADSVVVRQKVDCQPNGHFRASIPTMAVYDEGIYYLRGYTNLMRNFSGESFAIQPVLIGGTFPKKSQDAGGDIRCSVYPDGGFLAENHIQGLTVSLTDKYDIPVCKVNTSLVDDRGDTLCGGKTSESGLINLKFIPQANRNYHLSVTVNGAATSFDVPQARRDSVKLHCVVSGNRLKYEMLNANAPLTSYRIYIYDRESGLVEVSDVRQCGIVLLENNPFISTVFLTDNTGKVLSESTVISRYRINGLAGIPARIAADSVAGIAGRLSGETGKRVTVRLVKDNERWCQFAESEIMYMSDYSSPLAFPDAFFNGNAKERAADLQAWLATAKFCRFDISEALKKDTAMYVYMPEMNMVIAGTAYTMYRSSYHGGTLLAYNTENNLVYDTAIGKDGHFRIAVDDFTDGTTFFLQTIDKYNKPVDSKIAVDDDSYPAVYRHKRYERQLPEYAETKVTVEGVMTGRVLPDVIVKAKVGKDEALDGRHFYTGAYADRTTIEERNCQTLMDVLRCLPFVQLVQKGEGGGMSEWRVVRNRGNSTLTSTALPILLDGCRINDDAYVGVLNMPAFEIEEVEVLPAWQTLAYTWGALDGAVKVTTRSAVKQSKVRSKGSYYTPKDCLWQERPPDKKLLPDIIVCLSMSFRRTESRRMSVMLRLRNSMKIIFCLS